MDLKPKNLVFESDTLDSIILLDFGNAKFLKLNQNTQNTDVIGITLKFCAPEVNYNKKS